MRQLVLSIILLLFTFNSWASHIIGGEIYYDYIGNNQYRFYVAVYRDCASSGADFDSPLYLGVYTSSGSLQQTVTITAPPSTRLPIAFDNPCIKPPTGFCNERAIYSKVVTLPPRVGGYYISYQRCCRRPDVINIQNPGDTGLTLTIHVPTSDNNYHENSSPRFENYPPLVLCNNQELNFNHFATDPDGDLLVYDLYPPYAGATDSQPMPTPAPAPPYQQIQWRNGYSTANPFGAGATISLDQNTGMLVADPELQGLFVVGVRVREYRNGVLLSTVIRDFIFQVINCNVSLEAIIVPQNQAPNFVDYCQGTTVNFRNNSYGGTTYKWDFGVPNITSDVSTAFAPSYTFPAPGEYTVTLIVNDGMPCSDTSVQIFKVYENLTTDFSFVDSMCFNNNNYNFTGSYSGPANPTYEWNFGPNSTQSSNQINANNINFSSPGNQTVTFTAKYESCQKSTTKNVYVIPQPQASFEIMSNSECAGLTQQFNNTSTSSSTYHWDFGTNPTETSTVKSPTYTYTSPGTYTVSLLAGNGTHCFDSVSRQIQVNESLIVSFIHDDSLCISNPIVNFDASITGPANYTINWDFGNVSSPSSSTIEDPTVTYLTPGKHPVKLTVSLATCSVSEQSIVTIFKSPSIGFTFADRLYCTPAVVDFINQSQSQTPLTYFWELGNGQTATTPNASGIYTDSGIYSITLTIISNVGCIDTLTLTKDSLFKVNPSPVAAFELSDLEVDICNSQVAFIDRSSDALSYNYFFDDKNFRSFEPNPTHSYLTSGLKRPTLIVTNGFGCSDTATRTLYVEPFTVYIPNAFTPDGSELNEYFKPIIYLPVDIWEFKIFDRWGELIFESTNPTDYWDGTYKGLPVPMGIYTYRLDYRSCEEIDSERTIFGHVNVLR